MLVWRQSAPACKPAMKSFSQMPERRLKKATSQFLVQQIRVSVKTLSCCFLIILFLLWSVLITNTTPVITLLMTNTTLVITLLMTNTPLVMRTLIMANTTLVIAPKIKLQVGVVFAMVLSLEYLIFVT